MTGFRRFLTFLALLLGALGVVACVVAIGVVWLIGSRLSQTNENVFAATDKALTAVHDRMLTAQRRVQESKITAEEIGERVKNRTRSEARERLASELELEAKAERLVQGMQQADLWLEMSESSIEGVQQTLQMANSLGAPVDPALIDPLLERLTTLQRQLKQSTETVDTVRQRIAETAEGDTPEERISKIVQLVVRITVTLSEIDTRLAESTDRVADIQTRAQQLKSKTHTYIITAGICVVLLIAWMACGQACLCRYGWLNYRQH